MLQTVASGGLSASYINQLISESLSLQRRPIDLLDEERDKVEIQRAIYNDLNTSLSGLKGEVTKLISGDDSVMDQMNATSGSNSVLTATALSTATTGTYDIKVNTLAQAHQVRGEAQLYSDQALGFDGTFVLGNRATRSADWTPDAGGMVTGGATAELASGQTELKSGDYYVETQQLTSGVWQFRMVDSEGKGVSIADVDGEEGATSAWQTLADGASTYDTGRGLTIDFSIARAENLRPNAAMVSYSAQGATIDVDATHSLADIAEMINSATYAEGETVTATIIDRQLVLTSASTGIDHAINISTTDAPTGDVLSGLGLWDAGAWLHETQEARDANFTVNNISITRSRNTALDDVITGVTLNLADTTDTDEPVRLTVGYNNAAVTSQINKFVSSLNSATNYLSAKTAVTEQDDGTYTRGGLAGDALFGRLRLSLITDLLGAATGVSEGSPTALSQIGLSFDVDTLTLSLSDSTALSTALAENRAGVIELLDEVFSRIEERLSTFTGDDGLLQNSIEQIDSELEYLGDRKKTLETRLSEQEIVLTRKYSILLAQYANMQAEYNTLASLWTSTV